MNVYIWAIGALNQLFIRGSCAQIKFSKKRISQLPVQFVLILAFYRAVFYGDVGLSFVVL